MACLHRMPYLDRTPEDRSSHGALTHTPPHPSVRQARQLGQQPGGAGTARHARTARPWPSESTGKPTCALSTEAKGPKAEGRGRGPPGKGTRSFPILQHSLAPAGAALTAATRGNGHGQGLRGKGSKAAQAEQPSTLVHSSSAHSAGVRAPHTKAPGRGPTGPQLDRRATPTLELGALPPEGGATWAQDEDHGQRPPLSCVAGVPYQPPEQRSSGRVQSPPLPPLGHSPTNTRQAPSISGPQDMLGRERPAAGRQP